MSEVRQVLFMYKAPLSGQVKTRLAAETNDAFALEAYRQMGKSCFEKCSADVESWMFFSPASERELVESWIPNANHYRPQGEGDLGERLTAASREAFQQHNGKQVMMGADCPALDADILQQAWRGLDLADVVIGPAEDGGYYLIGSRIFLPELFQNIAWSTSEVFSQTCQRAESMGLRIHVLPRFSDIDTLADWKKFF